MISPLKPWSQFLPNFIYSIYRRRERIMAFFLSQSDKNSGCYGSLQLPLTYNGGKMKIGTYCYLTADILTEVLQKCSLSSPLPTIWILSKPLNLIGWHGSRKAKFEKKIFKIISEAIKRTKLKLCDTIYSISLYKKGFFLLPLLMHFHCYGNLKFP